MNISITKYNQMDLPEEMWQIIVYYLKFKLYKSCFLVNNRIIT